MRTELEIKRRLSALVDREFRRRLQAALHTKLPHQCKYNHRQPIDLSKRFLDGESNPGYNRLDRRHLPVVPDIGLCLHVEGEQGVWSGTICEEPADAQGCPFYTSKYTYDEVLQEFEEDLRSPEWLSVHAPEIAELMWVLEQASIPPMPWWKALWCRLIGQVAAIIPQRPLLAAPKDIPTDTDFHGLPCN